MYCVYKKYTYRAKLKNGKVILISYERKEGFSNYIDVVGNEHSDIFMKEVELGEVELIYNEDMRICYLGETFELLEPITATSVENDSYMLFTSSEQVAKRFEFEKKEQFVFIKEIRREQIECIQILRKPIKVFEDQGIEEIIVSNAELDTWLQQVK